MTKDFNSNHFKTITYSKQCCAKFHAKQIRFELLLASAKNALKPQKRNFARNLEPLTIVFNSNHFKKKIYTNYCCVRNFMLNKQNCN